jgi:hypothetical protein
MSRRIVIVVTLLICLSGITPWQLRAASSQAPPRITNIGVGVTGGIATYAVCVVSSASPAAGAVTVRGPHGNQQAALQVASAGCGQGATLMTAAFPRMPAGQYLFQAACVLLAPAGQGEVGQPVPCLVRDVGFVSNFEGLTVATTCQVDFNPTHDTPLRSCSSPGTFGNLGAPPISAAPAASTPTMTRVPSRQPVVEPAPAVAWTSAVLDRAFLAEGYAGVGYQEYISLLNPRPRPIDATVTLFRADGATRSLNMRIPGLTRDTVNVNTLAPRASTAVRIAASGTFVAERALYVPGGSGHIVAGAPLPARKWYVAEGYVGKGFSDGLRIFNPYDARASVIITAYDTHGAARASRFAVPGGARLNIALDDVAPTGSSSLAIESNEPVVTESVVQLSPSGATSAAMAIGGPSTNWYFPDGSTQAGDQAYVSLFNPGVSATPVHISVITNHGNAKSIDTLVAAHARSTLALGAFVHLGGFGLTLQSRHPIVAQEVRYMASGAASLVDPAAKPAKQWGLAEGYAGGAFHEWITVLNPGSRPSSVTVRLIGQRGYFGILTFTVPANHMHRLYVDGLLPQGAVSALVLADRPISVGRTLVFDNSRGLSTTSAVPLTPN